MKTQNTITKFLLFLFIFGALAVSASVVAAQENATVAPTPQPTPVRIAKKRTTGVKINSSKNLPENVVSDEEKKRLEAERIEREKQQAIEENSRQMREEYERREADLKAQKETELEAERKAKADELERLRIEAEAEKNRIAAEQAETQRQLEEKQKQIETEKLRKDQELAEFQKKADDERIRREQEIAALQKKAEEEIIEKDRLLAEASVKAENERLEKERLANEANNSKKLAEEAEAKRLEAERVANEKMQADNAEKAKMRLGLIEMSAKKLQFINAAEAFKFVPETALTAEEIENALKSAIASNPRLNRRPSFCDADYEGEPLNVMLSANPTLGGFLSELSSIYNVNFLPDPEVLDLPVAGDVKDVPWNYVLRSQLNYLDLEARCTNGNTIAILKRSKLQTLTENQKKTAPLKTEFIKLKYLQPVVGGQVNVAGRGTGGSNALESLEQSLNKIIRAEGDNRGSVSRIPGKNEFIITATDEQLSQIKQVIARADRPAYQVIIYASIVTANENKLKDVGGQVSAIGGSANLNLLGGLTGFGGSSQQSSGGSSGGGNSGGSTDGSSGSSDSTSKPGSLNPGGVRTLGQGFGNAPAGGSTFGISNIFGTVQLSAQLSLLQQQGVVKIDNRPSIIVVDGQTADLQIGRQVAIPIQNTSITGGGNNELQILNAGNTLNASPQVIEDELGNPVAVNLNLRVESNDVDTTVVSQGVPSIIRRSTQTSLMLNTSQTAVIGGFSTDSETNSESKTPGLGDVPLLGGLFKRKVKSRNSDRLYFAIRVEVVSQGQILTTIPMNIDTSPRLPNPNNDFFKPYNQPVQPQTNKQPNDQ